MPTNKTITGYEKKSESTKAPRVLTENPAQDIASGDFARNFDLSALTGHQLGGLVGVFRVGKPNASGSKNVGDGHGSDLMNSEQKWSRNSGSENAY